MIDPDLAAEALRSGPNPLTEHEQDILRLIDLGVSTDEIAKRLFLSRGTVRNYLSRAMAKLGAGGRIEALRHARARGLL